MNQVISKRYLTDQVLKLEVMAPQIAEKKQLGQYVQIKLTADVKRLTLQITQSNTEKGSITVLLSKQNTEHLPFFNLSADDELFSVTGPLGQPIHTPHSGTVLCLAEADCTTAIYPMINALQASGNRVLTALVVAPADTLILQREIQALSDEVTFIDRNEYENDWSSVILQLNKLFHAERVNRMIVFGNSSLLKISCTLAGQKKIATTARLFANQTKGKGNHAIFSVSPCGDSKYICVDSPDFNAYYTDFDQLIDRFERIEVWNEAVSVHAQ